MIAVSDITVRFGGVTALNSVTATFEAPITGVIGPNGAGKTTLLNVLSGFVLPDTGQATMDGRDLLSMAPYIRARAGLRRSFQAEQIAEDLSVIDNVAVMLDPLPLSRKEREKSLDNALAYTGLQESQRAMGSQLTNVERRLTEIAKTLAGTAKVLLLDEPGGGLGQSETDRLRAVIAGIPKAFDARILLIDHDVELIRSVCDQILVLDFGKVIAFGPTDETLSSPAVRAAYLGEDPDAAP